MTAKEKYELMEEFIKNQASEWETHCRDIGILGRLLEKIFGSNFAHQQRIAFSNFCTELNKKKYYVFDNRP